MSTAPAVIPEEVVVRRRWSKGLFSQPLAVVGAAIAIGWLLVAIFAPLIAPYDPLAQDFPLTQAPSRSRRRSAASSARWPATSARGSIPS